MYWIVVISKEMHKSYSLIAYALGQPKSFWENWDKLHRRLWTKRWLLSNFEHPPGISYHVPRAPKLAIIVQLALKGPISEPWTRGKIYLEGAQNGMAITFRPKVPRGVCPNFPPKNWAGLMYKLRRSIHISTNLSKHVIVAFGQKWVKGIFGILGTSPI